MAQQVIKSGGKQEKQTKKTVAAPATQTLLFKRRNYLILLAGLASMIIGYLLMSGGSQPADKFDPKVIYGFTRITLSTIFVVAGFVIVLFSIFAKEKSA